MRRIQPYWIDDVEMHVRRLSEGSSHPLVYIDKWIDQHDGLEPVPLADLHRVSLVHW